LFDKQFKSFCIGAAMQKLLNLFRDIFPAARCVLLICFLSTTNTPQLAAGIFYLPNRPDGRYFRLLCSMSACARSGLPRETVQNLGVSNWTGPFAPIEAATTLNRVTSIRATATIPTSALSFHAMFVHPRQ
jgi:hypothetical protein